jgi:hypothetical protein
MNLFGKAPQKTALPEEKPFTTRVFPLLLPDGTERFGVIELSSDYGPDVFFNMTRGGKHPGRMLTGGLRLTGDSLNLWLASQKDEFDFWSNLCAGLPCEVAGQFILRRRPGTLQKHYEQFRDTARPRLSDDETAYLFMEDYLDNLVYPVEEAALAQQEFFMLISACNTEELADSLASLFVALPAEAEPLTARDLSGLLREYGLGVIPQCGDSFISLEECYRAYWTMIAPPSFYEGGWTRPLLEDERVTRLSFAIVAHLTPGKPDASLRTVLERRRKLLRDMLDNSRHAGAEHATRDLTGQLSEVERRLATLENGQRFFEVSISFSLRSPPDTAEKNAILFEMALLDAGLSPRRICGKKGLELAWLDCAPVNVPKLARLMVVGEQPASGKIPRDLPTAGKLVQLACSSAFGNPGAGLPLAGYSRTGEICYLEPDPRLNLFMTGEKGARHHTAALNFVRYFTAMRFLQGQNFCIFDPEGEWNEVVRQMGDPVLSKRRPHFYSGLTKLNPQRVCTLDELDKWLFSTKFFLSALLELKGDEGLEDLLLEAAFEYLTNDVEVTPASLWERAASNGKDTLEIALSRLVLDGDLAWLFATEESLPKLDGHGLLVFGFEADERNSLPSAARRLIMCRALENVASMLQTHTLLVNELEWFLPEPPVIAALTRRVEQGHGLWAVAGTCAGVMADKSGFLRRLTDRAGLTLLFRQDGAGLDSFARRLNLSDRATRALRELAAGAALVRRNGPDGVTLNAFEPLPGDYTARLAPVKHTPAALPDARAGLAEIFRTLKLDEPRPELPSATRLGA